MFFEQPNLIFDIKEINMTNTPYFFLPVKKNVENCVQHKMELDVNDADILIKVDNIAESVSKFKLNRGTSGYISLVSNSYNKTEGSFLGFTVFENEKMILDLDFSKLECLDELENWFDCYHFTELNGKKARRVKISDFWSIEGGKLKCIKTEYGESDIFEFCLLTYTKRKFEDFKAVIRFEQCGYRYGLSFGCPIAQFPYYRDPKTMTIKAVSGGFAYIEQEGYRNLRGNIPRNLCSHPNYSLHSYKTPIETFYAKENNLSFSNRRHQLIFHLSSDAIYYFKNKVIFAKSGNITYIPPNTPYNPKYSVDKHITVDFDIINGKDFEADSHIPSDPSEFNFLFDKMLKTYHLHNDIHHYECTYNLYKIYALILKEKRAKSNVNTNQSKNYPKLLKPALEYLDSNFTDPNIKIPALAKMCHISETHFRKLFSTHMGTSPQKYIQRMRIDFSVFLLDSKYYKIYEIAEKSGFPNTKYFSTVFKEVMKITPTEWIENHSSSNE